MKCLSCQTPLEEDCNFCSECGNEVVSIPKIVLCKGKKKNGTICGAELQKGKKFCTKCGAKVDQSIFEKEELLCACCGRAFADDEDFCADCGLSRNDISVASSSSYQNLNTNNSSACYVHHANLDVQNEEQTSTPIFPASFYAASPGNLNVFGINAPLDGESINILPEGKDNICERASADHFDDDKDNNEGNNKHSYGSCFDHTESDEDQVMPSASLEEQKINRSKRKTEQSYENSLIKKKKIEDIKNNFPPNSGEPQQESLDNNTFVINVDSLIDLDNQLEKEEQTPILIADDGESILDIGVKESREITNDAHIEDKNESHVKGPVQETDINEDVQVEKDSLDIKKDEALANVEQASTSGGVKTRRNTRNNTEFVSVQFHALMSPEYNLTPTDVILVQFGAEELGGWMSRLHKCAIIRKTEEDYTEIKLEEDISKSLLFNKNKKIQYKYVVVRDGIHFICESYRAQRGINLPDRMKNMAEWHQYDGVVFPKPGKWVLNKIMTYITRNFKEREEREKKDLVRSIEYFLPKYYKDITSGKYPAMPMEEALTQLEQLLHTLRGVYFTERKCYTNMRDYERKISDLIIAPVLKSFKEISLSAWKESPQDSEIRMLRATMVVSALKCFNCELNLEEQELLAKGLLVRPNDEKACHELCFIEKTYSGRMKEQLNDAVISFIDSIAKTTRSPCIYLCMPLHHFLIGAVKPFEEVSADLSHDNESPTWWGTASVTESVKYFKKGSPSKDAMKFGDVFNHLLPLFEMDYLLPRSIMAMLTLNEAVEVIGTGRIPFEVCAANLTYFVKTSKPNEVKKVGDAIHSFRDVCRKAKIPDESSRPYVIQTMMFYKMAGDLLKETLKFSHQHLVVGVAAQTFLHAVAIHDMIRRSEKSEKPSTLLQTNHFSDLNLLYESVKRYQGRLGSWNKSFDFNLKNWENIFAPHDLPSEAVKAAWNNQAEIDLQNTLREQMQNSTLITGHLIEVYCRDFDSFHPSVQNCLGNMAFKAIETGYDVQMNQCGEHERNRFRKLLCSFFEKEWKAAMEKRGMEEDQLILHHILTWAPFSHFLKMFYGKEKELYLDESQACFELTQAVSLIEDRVHALENGTVTLKDLEQIKDAEDKFKKLIGIMFEKSNEQNGKPLIVDKAVKIRQLEVDSYYTQKKYVATLVQLCRHVDSVQSEAIELEKAMRDLEDKHNLCIQDICQPTIVESAVQETLEPKITAFKLSDSVIQVLKPLHESFKSSIFINLWQDIGHASKAKTLDDVCEQVWKPAHAKMKKIKNKILDGNVLFVELEEYLGKMFGNNEEKMVEEMMLINVSDEKARERVKQLKQYRQLEACVEGAKTILNVAKAYELSGDFEVIKTIASQEIASNKMMKEFDESLLKICAFLEQISSERTSCLDHFIKCKRLVQWLRESMKGGLKELKVFVDLASISAGEGDMEIAKVNCLHAATTGYAPLIFELNENSGYKELLDKCQILWKELKADPYLPNKLTDTNRHLEWLKTVKQAHGSVEVNSLAQAESINSKGIFYVGAINMAKNMTMGLNLQNTLQLTVPDDEEESQGHRQYTFEQLQDLQSRLMLVAGKAEQGKDDVDRFMLVSDSVMRLAKVFIKLNSAGCVLFKHWQTKFRCDPKRTVCAFIEFGKGTKTLKGRQTRKENVTTVIPKLARFMENCLDRWIGHINQTRLEYFELNYFTTDQLVILQQELMKVVPGQSPDIRIYPLLSAVKENCTYEDLVDAMKKASEDLEVVQMEVDEEHKEMEGQEDGKVSSDKTNDTKVVQNFIEKMIEAGFSEKLAEAALSHVQPEQITDGLIWCNENILGKEEEDTEDCGGNHPAEEAIPYEGWNKSDQSVMSLTAAILDKLEVVKGEMDVDPLITDLEVLWEKFLTSVSSSVTDYLSVEHLGLILRRLAENADSHSKFNRPFPPSFVPGTPNLIICPKADVLSTVLSMYMMDPHQPLPQADEVLVCTPQTTLDQLDVFFRRTVSDTSSKIHCLVNSDILDFEVSDRAERRLEHYMQETEHIHIQYRLVVICSAENEFKSRIITALDKFRRSPLVIRDIHHIANYMKTKLQVKNENTAATVDFDSSTVRVVKSWRAGVGKSLYVKRRNEELMQKNPHHKMTDLVNIPLQEKEINISQVTQILLTHILPPGVTTPRIFHLDIAYEVQEGVNYFLFNLLILGCLTDKSGYVWRRSPRDLYLVETIPIIESVQRGSACYVHHVIDFLPFLTCRSPQESLNILTNRPKPRDFQQEDLQFDLKEFNSSIFQMPYQYLNRLDQRLRIDDVDPNVVTGTPADCLKVLLRHCGVPDPSWAELHHFVWFFNTQLRDFRESSFCSATVAEDLPGFSTFVLRFLIQMSRDFSTRSLQMSEESPATIMKVDDDDDDDEEEEEEGEGEEVLAQYQMRRTWESSPHPYLFFNPDGHTITFLGFNIERSTGNLIDQQTRQVLETAIMPQNLYDSLIHNRVPIQENFDSLPRERKIERLCQVMGNTMPHDPDDTYELTTDNVKKILAIYMRFRCDIPVIIMGETGCGKTRLVKFMCALQTPSGTEVLNMILMKVHGGTTNADIKRKVEEARTIAKQNTDQYGPHMYTVLFFDEANTTEAIGMIKEIMCDKSFEGKPLDTCDHLRFVAACNPYRKHSEDLIQRLEHAGLGYHVDADKTTDRLGRIPMRRLVYRVQPLPQSLLPLVWDFGQLNTQIEVLYIRQMVRRYIKNGRLPRVHGLIKVVSRVLTASQDFMREQQDECSFVSLRDVERALNVMSWFYAQSQDGRTLFNQMDEIIQPFTDEDMDSDDEEYDGEVEEEMESIDKDLKCVEQEYAEEVEEGMESKEVQAPDQGLDDITRSLVLALGVCYHACLKNRAEYRIHVASFFRAPCNLPYGPDQIEQEISTCQDVFLENVQLEKNIAKNTALKENVFMMVTSIELRIPLFLVGKPGSSKSLAKTIVADAMQGNAAHKDLFKEFKQVQMVSFQCSPLSTPDGIVGTFRQCAQFQKDKDLERFASVVVLDEVGLAEDSPRMPLKTLHPLLEDGCQGDEEPQPHKKVAFIGISNWALDPAKMNRGILVQREVPDLEELMNTANGICGTKNHVYNHVKPFIEPLAISYLNLFQDASCRLREFFGLRDFYSLMKMIYSFVEQTNKPPTWHQLLHSIKRNFGGLDTINPVYTFASRLTMVDRNAERREGDPDDNTASLITANNIQSESRYLLLLTENYGALTIMHQLIPTSNNIITIFGSSFPSDQEYTQVCRNINRIKVCMETGNTVVLLNLENLYESLYDALNQYYVYFGGERYVDLGLGTHRVKCRVHKNFRLIVVAEKDAVYKKFPIPLINRLEKHFLTVNTILNREQNDLAQQLEEWAKEFSTATDIPIYMQRNEKNKFIYTVGEVFMGYHTDTCSSIILYIWKRIQEDNPLHKRRKILHEAKKLLLWCATPDSVVRLESCSLMTQEKMTLKQVYMREQCHDNLAQYLKFKLQKEQTQQLFAQITTHSKLLSTADKSDIYEAVGIPPERIALETLQSFDTEQQFNRTIRSFLESSTKEEILLVVQCTSGDTNANLVACARYCIQDVHQQAKDRRTAACHVILIIQLPRIAGGCFTGFQCGQWHSAHLDDLRAHNGEIPSILEMLGKSVGSLMEMAVGTKSADSADMEVEEMFKVKRDSQCDAAMETDDLETEKNSTQLAGQVEADGMEWEGEPSSDFDQDHGNELQEVIKERVDHKLDVHSLILSCIQPALSMVKDEEETTDRSTQRIELMLFLLQQNPIEGLPTFLHGLSYHVATLQKVKERTAFRADNWLSTEAAMPENISKAGTFRQTCIQYFESKISPILAGIIAHIDTNHNLDIIRNNISSGDWKARLWLHIFDTPGAIQLKYSDLQSPTKQQELREVVVKTTGCAGQMFDAVMPFSWLIYEQTDIIWRTAQEEYGEEETPAKIEKIVGSLKESVMGQLLDTLVGNVSTDEIVHLYVQDFTCIVYHTRKPEEHELVVSTILKTYSTLQGNVSPGIVAGLVWIHESHHRIVQDLQYFRSVNEVWPECAEAVKCKLKDPQNSDSLELVNLGLSLLIQQLSPQDLNSSKSQQNWLQGVYDCRPVIEKGLACYTFTDTSKMDDAIVKAQKMWTKVIVVKLFIEHVASDEETQKYVSNNCMAIWGVLGDTPDFKKEQSLEKVEKFLKICNKTAIKDLLGQEPKCCKCERKMESIPVTLPCKHAICMQCYYEMEAIHSKECPHCSKEIPSDFDSNAPASQREVQIFKNFQSRCNSFFIDIVSQLCFANNTAPSDEVMDKLLGYITMLTPSGKSGNMETRQLTKELTIFNDCVDPNPVFRSFLLQLLIKTSTEKVTAYLEMYFKQAESMIGKDNIDLEMHMVQLCQLVVHCLEDSYYLEAAEKDSVTIATKYLDSAGQEMQDSSVWMAGIYFIAKARFGMAVTAKHIHETILSNKKQTVTLQQQQMIEQAAILCEGDCKWPKNFFIKYLCRCYGQDSYEALCKNFSDTTYLGWTRYELEEIGKVREVSDRYIVCGPHYIKIREAVTRVGLGEDIDHLDSTIMDTKKEIPGNKLKILFYLTLHREITMSNLYDNNKSKVKPKAIEILQKYCSETEDLKNEDLAERILLNKYGLQSSFLNVTCGLDLKHQGVLCVLMHIDLVLRNLHGDSTLLQPLVRLATQPERMKVSFIPTMPQDDVQEIKEVLLAHRVQGENPVFYYCPNGHPYYIGNCGRAWVESKCPQCGAKIGGQSHNLLTDNKRNEGQDLTETGHVLGDSELRKQCEPERSMTPVNCAVIRLLTHLTMMLGANINSQAVSEFIKPNIPKENVPQFLWKHIEHDLDDLHRALGKSIDEVFVIMHSILSDMLEKHSENEQLEEDICSLATKKARDDWEKRFLQKHLVPLFQNIENLLKDYNEQIVLDKRLGSDPLQCLLYEVTPGQENISLTNLQEIPSMWRYQSRITMDHLHHEFEVQMTATNKNQHRILGLFLKEEQHLRAIRYIPSILKLQRILFQKYMRKLAKAEASKITVEMLKKELNGDEQKCLLDEYAEAWDLVRHNIETVPMDYRRERISKSTPVSWFLPTLSGAGLCAYSLLTFLLRKQNNFLDHYYPEIKNSVKPRVRVRDITPAHLIRYHPEKDILPLVLANCNYSFEMGKGTTIEYNFANLERQIMDRFFFGKSLINIEIELMVFRAEYTNVTVFTKLQEKIPQVPLRTAAKHKISAEFQSVPDLYQALDNLDIAISFLKSIGGNPENSLDRFMVETLKMKESLLGPKAKQICQYQHVKALWLLLSLKNTRKLAHHNQVIFEGVPDQFHQQLSNELQEQVTTFLQLLSVERLEVLLELMFECIVLVISVPQDPNDEDYVDPTDIKFKDYLFGLQETKDLNQNQGTDQDGGLKERGVDLAYELEKFPDEVFNKFCVETWKLANHCLETRTQT